MANDGFGNGLYNRWQLYIVKTVQYIWVCIYVRQLFTPPYRRWSFSTSLFISVRVFSVCVWNPKSVHSVCRGNEYERNSRHIIHWPKPQRAAHFCFWVSSNMCFQCSVVLWEIILVSFRLNCMLPALCGGSLLTFKMNTYNFKHS